MLEYFTSGKFLESIIVIAIGALIIIISNALDKRYLKTKSANDKWYGSAKMVVDFINSIIITILVFIVLSINGVKVGKYVTSLGVIGIIASFALQDILKDVIMGLSIMFEGYFKVGDVVEYNGMVGKVVSFNVKTTRIFMLDTEATLSICNRNISQIGICSDWVDIQIPIGYEVDLRYARNLCRECAKKIERLRYVYRCDFLNTQELAESWIEYKLRIHCLAEKKPSVRRNAQAVVQDVFYEHKQEFPLSIKVLYNVDPKTLPSMPESEKKKYKVGDDTVVYEMSGPRKRDYELGRGAEKSKVCAYDGSEKAISTAAAEAERYAVSENLGKSMQLRLRLLSEELLSLTRSLPNVKDGNFYVERDGNDYDICFDAIAKINRETKENILRATSENAGHGYSGISGMVAHAIDSMIVMSANDKKGLSKAGMDAMEESIGKAGDDYKWSYNIYKEKEMDDGNGDEDSLDAISAEGLGRSVLTKLSDDIRVSFRKNRIYIRVLVKNEEDD